MLAIGPATIVCSRCQGLTCVPLCAIGEFFCNLLLTRGLGYARGDGGAGGAAVQIGVGTLVHQS